MESYQYVCGGVKRDMFCIMLSWASLVAQLVKNPPVIQETWV